MKLTYKCKQNDVVLKLIECDKEISEIWIRVQGETSYTVIGYEDLITAIQKAKDKFK